MNLFLVAQQIKNIEALPELRIRCPRLLILKIAMKLNAGLFALYAICLNPVVAGVTAPLYILIAYQYYILLKFCAKFGYKKSVLILLVIVINIALIILARQVQFAVVGRIY
ncbi:hypothetical protein FACS1894219_05400 [Clostridia bacterium]|nr:hypothetical protein FACS1894219_05400 [Clostridia bacterium]